jgi:hypothetical protein
LPPTSRTIYGRGTIRETGETDEKAVVEEQIEFLIGLIGLTGLPLFSPVPSKVGRSA